MSKDKIHAGDFGAWYNYLKLDYGLFVLKGRKGAVVCFSLFKIDSNTLHFEVLVRK